MSDEYKEHVEKTRGFDDKSIDAHMEYLIDDKLLDSLRNTGKEIAKTLYADVFREFSKSSIEVNSSGIGIRLGLVDWWIGEKVRFFYWEEILKELNWGVDLAIECNETDKDPWEIKAFIGELETILKKLKEQQNETD